MCQPCPVCGREALAVIDQKTSERINLYGMYRHERNGRVWLHLIKYGGQDDRAGVA
jgi:hypothetical protein